MRVTIDVVVVGTVRVLTDVLVRVIVAVSCACVTVTVAVVVVREIAFTFSQQNHCVEFNRVACWLRSRKSGP